MEIKGRVGLVVFVDEKIRCDVKGKYPRKSAKKV